MFNKHYFILILVLGTHFICLSQSENDTLDLSGNSTFVINLPDSLKSIMDEYSSECYKIEISFDGYESKSEETWYYDSLGVICGYHSTWALEGQSGEEFHWYENGKIFVIYDETLRNSGDPEITFLKSPTDSKKLKSYELTAGSMELKILNLIKENPENTVENEYNISINIQETVNYGAEFIQNTDIYIDKALYNIFFKTN